MIYTASIILVAIAAAVLYFNIGYHTIIGHGSNVLSVVYSLFASILLIIAARSFRKRELLRQSWSAIAYGIALYFLGETSWLILVVRDKNNVPYPSIADLFWLLGYIPLFVGVLLAYKNIGAHLLRKEKAGVLALCLILLSLTSFYVFAPIFSAQDISMTEKALDFAYPFLDIILLALSLVIVVLYERGILGTPWILISIAFVAFSITDILFSYMTWNEVYKEGSIIDIGWLLAYTLMMTGAWLQLSIQKTQFVFSPPKINTAPKKELDRDLVGIV